MADAKWVDEVLGFWFSELTPDDWYRNDPALDARITERFGLVHEALEAQVPPEVQEDPRAALAAVIVFDQMSRNMFRRTAQAFATDPLALEIARNAFHKGFDAGLSKDETQFLAMPLMHSEDLGDQQRCVAIFRELANENGLRFAEEHRDIVARFGRFPHRNKALGRDTTQEEAAFMEGRDTYGQ